MPEDVAAADAAMKQAELRKWLVFETSLPFDFEIYCDNAAELSAYAEERKLRGPKCLMRNLPSAGAFWRRRDKRLACDAEDLGL